jgi:hypothetical protein
MNMPQIALHGLPKRLVDDQLIAATVIEEASASAKIKKISLVQYLCDKQLLSSHQIGESAAKEFGIPLYALDKHNPDYFPQDIVDSKLLKKHQAIPLMVRGQRLFWPLQIRLISTPLPRFNFRPVWQWSLCWHSIRISAKHWKSGRKAPATAI